MAREKDEKRLKCPKCGYTWTYTGKLLKATCPSCGQKVDKRECEAEEK